jgi:DNA processing protein
MLNRRQAFLVLNALPHLGPITLRHLLNAFDNDPVAVLQGQSSKLKQVEGVGVKIVETLVHWKDHFDLEQEERHLAAKGARFITWDDEDYPVLLRQTYDPPIGLYWMGQSMGDQPGVAIVGSRRTTLYGQAVARKLAAGLARHGYWVISGLARGIDSAAHQGALEVDGGRTGGVLGCGIDIIYPPENLELYRRMSAEGAVVSEFPFGRRADRQSFPMRNRVVAGMCQGLVVVESDVHGGSMISARFAMEQNRQVFAVPGRIDQATSQGCHQLIRDGAVLVTCVEDILAELGYGAQINLNLGETDVTTADNVPPPPNLDGDEALVHAALGGGEDADPDSLADRLDVPVSRVASALVMLEMKRLVVRRADGRYEAGLGR